MPSRSTSSRKRKKKSNPIGSAVLIVFQFFLSPLVLLWDSFRKKGFLGQTWLFLFCLFVTLILILTGMGILVIEEPLFKTLTMMSTLTQNREILTGQQQTIVGLIDKYALENDIDPNLVYAMIKTESDFQPKAVSPAGARGLMQIMPEVWRQYSQSTCSGDHSNSNVCGSDCVYNPEPNIRVGTEYLHVLLKHYQGRVDLALEAYNAGIANVTDPEGAPKFQETRGYMDKTVNTWRDMRKNLLNQQLLLTLHLQDGLKWLFGIAFTCWLILFWWCSRKIFSK